MQRRRDPPDATTPTTDDAVAALRKALSRNPNDLSSLRELAQRLYRSGRFREASARLRQLAKLQPDDPGALHDLALALIRDGDAKEARVVLQRAVAMDPQFAIAHVELANLAMQSGRLDEAEHHYRLAIAIDGNWSVPHANLGALEMARGRPREAEGHYREALARNDGDVDARNGLGCALLAAGPIDDAIVELGRAVALDPDHVLARINLGRALRETGSVVDALALHRAVVDASPRSAEAWDELALDQWSLDDYAAALVSSRRAVAVDPGRAVSHAHLGNILADRNELDAAIASYRQALRLAPALAIARWNLAIAELTKGDFRRGWDDYEARWLCAEFPSPRRPRIAPDLEPGVDPDGRTVLVYAEQGYGDTIQFLRLVPELVRRGASVLLEVPRPLAALVRERSGFGRVFEHGDALPAFDCQVPLLSLPRVLGRWEPDASSVPYLRPSPPASRPASRPLRAGVVWAGGGGRDLHRRRSIGVDRIAHWFDIEGIEWVGLQKDMPVADADLAARTAGLAHGTAFADFADTATCIEGLDLVVGVDTAVVHLAGAMGKPVWILLPHAADFRWYLGRDDSPWYPGVRLFRCPAAGRWDDAIEAVRAALVARIEST